MKNEAVFSGEPQTEWLTEAVPDRRMRLLADFWYDDPHGRRWEVPMGYEQMDGASIPRALWTLIGSPYTGDYRRASIVHDYACDQAAGSSAKRRLADKMFFHACMTGGCSWKFAIVLYIGVRIGAWSDHVNGWKSDRTEKEDTFRLVMDANEQRMQADFRQIAERVLNQGKTGDPEEVEKRVTAAAILVLGRLPRLTGRRRSEPK
ncbi:MAG: DUF1353 domain-containing protein [Dokdonella sp.]